MHTQVMSNNNGTGAQVSDLVAQVISVVDKEFQEALDQLAKSIKAKNKKLGEMQEKNKKLKVTHKEQVLKQKQDHSK